MKTNLSLLDTVSRGVEWRKEQEKLWQARAADYKKLDWTRKDDFMNFMVDFCEPQSHWRVLDVGAGPGGVATALLPRVAEVVGVDLAPAMVNLARREHRDKSNLRFEQGDMEALPVEEHYFDLVTARLVLHHVEDCLAGLSEAYRALKPGGCCVVCEGVPPDHLTRDRYQRIFALKELRHTFSEAELINYFDEVGFENITVRPYFMRQVSLNNWLVNAALPEETIEEIRMLHIEADSHFKRVYRLKETGGDVLMDWKFIFIKGFKK